MTPEVSAVVVNYNAGNELALALESIVADCAQIPWEAVIVDNASTDGSAEAIEANFKEVKLSLFDDNIGFAAANKM